jgi:preprotein translocase subunit YajC
MDPIILLMLAAFMLFIFYSNKKRKDAATKMENSVQVGAKVVMLGGILGVVVEVRDGTLIIESTPGTKLEFAKGAVRSVEQAEEAPVKVKKTTSKKSEK